MNFHFIELEILKKLLFSKSLTFTELKPSKEMENSQFKYHLDKLIADKLVTLDNKKYFLTQKGKETANTLDSDKVIVKKQAKISVWVCARRLSDDLDHEYLIYTRKKHPFFGSQGFLSGKLDYGELVLDGAKRELFEETNLVGNAKLVCIKHYIVFDKHTTELVEDKFMFLCLVDNPNGELISNEEGDFEWIKKSQFKEKVKNPFESYEEFLNDISLVENFNGQIELFEMKHMSEKF